MLAIRKAAHLRFAVILFTELAFFANERATPNELREQRG